MTGPEPDRRGSTGSPTRDWKVASARAYASRKRHDLQVGRQRRVHRFLKQLRHSPLLTFSLLRTWIYALSLSVITSGVISLTLAASHAASSMAIGVVSVVAAFLLAYCALIQDLRASRVLRQARDGRPRHEDERNSRSQVAQFLIDWADLEALIRQLSRKKVPALESEQSDQSPIGSDLIDLQQSGVISKDMASRLRDLMRVRNTVAHDPNGIRDISRPFAELLAVRMDFRSLVAHGRPH